MLTQRSPTAQATASTIGTNPVCSECKNQVVDKAKSFKCRGCLTRFHAKCVVGNYTEAEVLRLNQSDISHFFVCKSCQVNKLQYLKITSDDYQSLQARYKNEMLKAQTKSDELKAEITARQAASDSTIIRLESILKSKENEFIRFRNRIVKYGRTN